MKYQTGPSLNFAQNKNKIKLYSSPDLAAATIESDQNNYVYVSDQGTWHMGWQTNNVAVRELWFVQNGGKFTRDLQTVVVNVGEQSWGLLWHLSGFTSNWLPDE